MSSRSLRAAALACLAVVLGSFTCALTPQLATGRADELALSTLGVELSFALLALAGAALSPLPLGRRLGLGPGRLSSGQIALLALGTLALSYGLDALLESTGLRERTAMAEVDAALQGAGGRVLLLAVFGLAVAPGVAEELLCRGLVQRGLERSLGPAAAILLAGLLFGALHIEPAHAGTAAVLGVYLGAVAWLAGSVRASVVCHAVNNLMAVVGASFTSLGSGSGSALPLGLGLAAGVFWLVWRRAGTPPRLESR